MKFSEVKTPAEKLGAIRDELRQVQGNYISTGKDRMEFLVAEVERLTGELTRCGSAISLFREGAAECAEGMLREGRCGHGVAHQ
jgi:uncharacterized membrane-anchored protein